MKENSFNGAVNIFLLFTTTKWGSPMAELFYLLTYFNKRVLVAGQGTWGWRRMLKIKNDCKSLTWREPWPSGIASSLFKLKKDTTQKTSSDPSGLGLETGSSIMLGAHIFKERRPTVTKTWINRYMLASSSQGIYLQIEAGAVESVGF